MSSFSGMYIPMAACAAAALPPSCGEKEAVDLSQLEVHVLVTMGAGEIERSERGGERRRGACLHSLHSVAGAGRARGDPLQDSPVVRRLGAAAEALRDLALELPGIDSTAVGRRPLQLIRQSIGPPCCRLPQREQRETPGAEAEQGTMKRAGTEDVRLVAAPDWAHSHLICWLKMPRSCFASSLRFRLTSSDPSSLRDAGTDTETDHL